MTASDDRIPLAPHRPPQSEIVGGFTLRLLDRLLMLTVAVLAFLLSLLPAYNSDLWLHLACGRLLSHGQYSFGVDPFSFTTTGIYWVNSSWLYDWLSFFLFQTGGGAALVLGKAVLAALLGWVLIRLCRTGQDEENDRRSGTALAFAVLTLLVVGSSMPLRPICVSYLFLALTLWLLETRIAGGRPGSLASWWPLFLLFALWANLDAWFLLGPLTVGMYALGSLATGRHGFGAARQLGLVCFVGLAACLLNPHHYHAFALPPLPFLAESKILTDDPLASGPLFLSPFGLNYLRFRDIPHLGRLLYYVLVFLGAVSFVLNGMAARSGVGVYSAYLCRLPAWLVFFAVSALDASTIPFMAIVCGPVTALNFQEWRRRKTKRSAALSWWMIGGRILSLAIVLGLLVAAWPGWLQGQLRQPRGWTVESDTSLVDAVHQVARWRREGRIRDGEIGFNFSPSVAHYFAWFAPEEKSFYDSRWRLFSSAATSGYATVRRALLGDASALNTSRNILREYGVAYLVLHDSEVQRTAAVFQRLVTVPDEWPILFLKGDTIVFGWRDPRQANEPDRFANCRVDFRRRAFQPSESERAPARGVESESNASAWRSFWTTASSAPAHDRDEAALYLIYFDMLRPSYLARHRSVWELSLATALVVSSPLLSALPSRFLDFTALQTSRDGPRARAEGGVSPLSALALRLAENYGHHRDDGPPGLLFLAIRAARRAVHENPDDAQAYQLLGEAYLHLMHNSRERVWKYDLPLLAHLRQIQAACALHQSLLLQPDVIQTHTDLLVLYQDMGLLDLALPRARLVLHLTRTRGQFTGESREAWAERLRQMEELVHRLDDEVQRRLNNYEIQAVRRSVLEQAVLAQQHGLGRKALDILLASDVAVFGARGTEMELDLLLTSGRIRDAREWMTPDQGAELSEENYHRFRILLAASEGDYSMCQEELDRLAAPFERPIVVVFDAWKVGPLVREQTEVAGEKPRNTLNVSARQALSLKVVQLLLDLPLQRQSILWSLTTQVEKVGFLERLKTIFSNIRQQAQLDVLRGVLALERGEVPQVESFLRRALSVWQSDRDTALGGGLDFDGRHTAQAMLDWLSQREQTELRP